MNNISGGSYASYVAGYTYTASGLNKTEKKEQKRTVCSVCGPAGISVIKRIKYRASFMVCGILLFL